MAEIWEESGIVRQIYDVNFPISLPEEFGRKALFCNRSSIAAAVYLKTRVYLQKLKLTYGKCHTLVILFGNIFGKAKNVSICC